MTRWLVRAATIGLLLLVPMALFLNHPAHARWRTVSDLVLDSEQLAVCTDGIWFVAGEAPIAENPDPATLPATLTRPVVAVSPPFHGSGQPPASSIVNASGETITLDNLPWLWRSDSAAPTLPDLLDEGHIYFGEFTVHWTRPLAPGTQVMVSFDNIFGDFEFNEETFVVADCDLFDFGGFRAPISGYPAMNAVFLPGPNVPTMNMVRAGDSIPIPFTLNGYQGLNIVPDGYPKSRAIPCGIAAHRAPLLLTNPNGRRGLSYDADTDTYTYRWTTPRTWAGSCRQFVLKLVDGTVHVANFQFR